MSIALAEPKTIPFEPYFDRDGITIYNADCRKVLPFLGEFDLLLTDPPYGIADKWKGGAGGKSSWKIKATETHDWDQETPADIIGWVMRHAGEGVIWGGNYYELPPTRCWLLWDKKQPDNWTTAQAEMAWTTFDKPVRTYRMAQCEAHTEMGHKAHPTQKPISLMRWCMKWAEQEQGTILDPFMGSGTTLVAAKLEGRKAVGIEINEKYCESAAKRLEQEVLF